MANIPLPFGKSISIGTPKFFRKKEKPDYIQFKDINIDPYNFQRRNLYYEMQSKIIDDVFERIPSRQNIYDEYY